MAEIAEGGQDTGLLGGAEVHAPGGGAGRTDHEQEAYAQRGGGERHQEPPEKGEGGSSDGQEEVVG